MNSNEITIAGISISKGVVSAIVSMAAAKVEGVAAVGGNDITSSLISVFTKKETVPEAAVESAVEDGKLKVTVHISVFYGYAFTRLADEMRKAVANAIEEQIGVEVGSVDVCIDSLVFPKE
ncbi:MAG: Asp23/Gls24 family envelope stress response protein [Atopobiaceae bacterium]|jgi:uncharacterized alkaline shock family protein YloU